MVLFITLAPCARRWEGEGTRHNLTTAIPIFTHLCPDATTTLPSTADARSRLVITNKRHDTCESCQTYKQKPNGICKTVCKTARWEDAESAQGRKKRLLNVPEQKKYHRQRLFRRDGKTSLIALITIETARQFDKAMREHEKDLIDMLPDKSKLNQNKRDNEGRNKSTSSSDKS